MLHLLYSDRLKKFILLDDWTNLISNCYNNPYTSIKSSTHYIITDIVREAFTIESHNSRDQFIYTDIFKIKRDFPELFI